MSSHDWIQTDSHVSGSPINVEATAHVRAILSGICLQSEAVPEHEPSQAEHDIHLI
jgi:hypothetical protein